ncbi:hypothetical protein HZU75_08100 [Chitinibacter fontanus]|uniref:Uncharacterized protein n=1 Tax=Chitinibacter fontanus TaxID=1737446 RepID=A0A7D5VA10_9NEIS|nr:hypothetical protein [Chitinibacter fontanus]QLI81492.1 hypothetical protein HZU75_08100 [Chitinibacter fontanus]
MATQNSMPYSALISRLFGAVLLIASSLVLAEDVNSAVVADDETPAYMITQQDVPSDAPLFKNYAVSPIYHGRIARPDVKSTERARRFRTMIRIRVAETGVNFAGHYALIVAGCGTACVEYFFVDVRTGRVYHPPQLQWLDMIGVDSDTFPNQEAVEFYPDSRLLVVRGMPNEDKALRGISYFVWDAPKLKRIRFVPKAMD